MTAPYLVEVRTGGNTKAELRAIINEVADEFGVRGTAEPRAVPHIPLFGRYDTSQGPKVKDSLIQVLSEFDVVPYRVSGFDAFEDPQLVYANVVPSPELCLLRRRIAEALRPLTYDYPPRNGPDPFEFYIPVAYDEDGRDFDTEAILDFLRNRYDVTIDEYATRITNLDGRRMLWEYDLLQDEVLGHDEATSRESWQQTESLLDDGTTGTDHDFLVGERVGSAVALAQREGWEYFPEPHEHVTRRARRDGLYQADGTMRQRELYFGDNYAYLVFASARHSDDIHVLSQEKSELHENTVEQQCPICQTTVRQHEKTPLLPCHNCGLQYELRDDAPDYDALASSEIAETCTRCKRPILSGGIQFGERMYCDGCVDKFESVAEQGVVVQSRHGEPDHDQRPYIVQWNDTGYVEDSQVAALARGKELVESNDIPGLFIYRRRGSHWLLDAYLDAHPEIRSEVQEKRRQIRGEDRVQIETAEMKTEPGAVGHNIRAGGDVFIADTAVKDAVVNRSDIGEGDRTEKS